ncbi:MAG TPA: hypothetical protein VKA46_22545 [Gemmataceae bacterium]|nr:hypothetical protein [Gemmataceae bacterium]
MKSVSILLATGLLLLGGSAVWAGEAGGTVGTLQFAPVPAAPPGGGASAGGEHCGGHSDGGGHSGRFWDWLLYKPPSDHCACHCCVISNCIQPNYMWFLDMCQGGCGGGCSHGAPAPVHPQ